VVPPPRPNKRVKLAGAAKQGRVLFVHPLRTRDEMSVRHARELRARSLRAVR